MPGSLSAGTLSVAVSPFLQPFQGSKRFESAICSEGQYADVRFIYSADMNNHIMILCPQAGSRMRMITNGRRNARITNDLT
jgi:hypothetical protein